MAGLVYVNAIDQSSRLPPAPAGTMGNGRKHLEIPQQSGGRGFCLRLLFVDGPARLQEQRRFFEDPVAHPDRGVTPGCVQLACLAAAELVAGESACHPFAVFDVGARRRNQILHGYVRRNLPAADLLLDSIREEFNESQAT